MKICAPRRLFGGFAAIAFLGLILAFPSQSARGISDGLGCCALQVIPALFPFFVVANLLIASPLANGLGALVWPFTRFGLGIKGQKAATALLVSWLGGFAVAAGTVSQLYRQGQLSRRQAQLLLVCGVGSGPAFILNTVGLLMLGSTRLGACLFAALLCANLCTGIAMRFALPPLRCAGLLQRLRQPGRKRPGRVCAGGAGRGGQHADRLRLRDLFPLFGGRFV